MMRHRPRPALLALTMLAALAAGACGGGRGQPRGEPDRSPSPSPRRPALAPPNTARVYQQMGLLAEGGTTPFVGSVAFLAGPTSDSTATVLTVSMPSSALTFVREGDRYRASYGVTLELRPGTGAARRVEAQEIVRVGAFRETTRADESIIFRNTVNIAPGTYDIALTVRDDAGNKSGSVAATLTVPRLGEGSISTPVLFYEVAPRTSPAALPRLVATPRSTITFGQDSTVPVYVEGYGTDSTFPLRVSVRGETGRVVYWSDTVSLPRNGAIFSGVVRVPVSRIGIGVMMLAVHRVDGRDSSRAPLFVTFGEDLPVATFTEMLNYLRYFAAPTRLQALRDAPPERRATAWAEFLRATDPVPATPQHEGLRDYFARVNQANTRFREEGMPGWQTDRGRVFISLGNPDQVLEPSSNMYNQRGRAQIWEYQRHRLQVVFVDQTGYGRWKMTLQSESEFESVVRREVER